MKVLTRSVVAAFVLVPSLAQAHKGSMQDELACTPDVYRLCSQFIPDEDDIVACLQKNRQNLSAGCHEVFSRPENMTPNAAQPNADD